MQSIHIGSLLISDPFMKDPNFLRSVVLICRNQQEGSFGFIINKPYEFNLDSLLGPEVDGIKFPVYYGGPVQLNSLFFIHQKPDLITGGNLIRDGIYWGGDFSEAIKLIKTGQLQSEDIHFFIGYSGWDPGQLQAELDQKSWIVSDATKKLLFKESPENIWKASLLSLGGEFVLMSNYPIDPQLN